MVLVKQEGRVTMIENKFNLVEEPWIPVVGKGLVSLSSVFSDSSLTALGGNPIQKIALTKLLLAIAQTAYTPKDDEDWKNLGADGMAKKSLEYLKDKKDLFWLYGEKPFLQMSGIKSAEEQNLGVVSYYVATGNTTVLTQSQAETFLSDAEKAMLLIQLMGFALGGKKTDNKIVLTAGYLGKFNAKGKASTGKFGPNIGFMGFLHSLLLGMSLQESIWINLLTKEDVIGIRIFSAGIGDAPWERMPSGEDCEIAQALKNSYMGRLLPISRFIYFTENGLHYSEGILHLGYNEGISDPSIAINYHSKKPKALWVDPEKRPWRQLTSLLAFLGSDKKEAFDCLQLRLLIPRVKNAIFSFGVWSGGLRVSSNAGEQYVSGSNDFVESEFYLNSKMMDRIWFAKLEKEMEELNQLSKIIYGITISFYSDQKIDGKDFAAQASNLFWQLCERKFQGLINACNNTSENDLVKMHYVFSSFANKAYDTYCPKETARQLDAWAANRPNLSKYLAM